MTVLAMAALLTHLRLWMCPTPGPPELYNYFAFESSSADSASLVTASCKDVGSNSKLRSRSASLFWKSDAFCALPLFTFIKPGKTMWCFASLSDHQQYPYRINRTPYNCITV